MQLTDEAGWSASDFLFLGALIVGVGVPLDLTFRKTGGPAYRWAVVLSLAAASLVVFVNGAVGVLGSEANDVNALFGGVLVVALLGALVARFRPRGMARAMAATTLAQASVAVGALFAGWTSPEGEVLEIVALWFFVALWAASAALFRRAALERPPRSAGVVG